MNKTQILKRKKSKYRHIFMQNSTQVILLYSPIIIKRAKDDLDKPKFIKRCSFGDQFSFMGINDKNINSFLTLFFKDHKNKALFLNHNQITDKGWDILIDHIMEDNIIEHLVLAHNTLQLNNCSLNKLNRFLYKNETINFLVLSHNKIKDEGIINLSRAINRNRSIKHLILNDNQMTDKGLDILLFSLMNHNACESIFISNNKLSNISLSKIILFLKKNKRIKRLNISGNNFTDLEQLSEIVRICKSQKIILTV